MSRQDEAPWDLYSKAMFSSYGFPLWHADPRPFDINHAGSQEIQLGSIGYVDEGKFRHLFNSMKHKHHPFNDGRVPETFEPFNPDTTINPPLPTIHQPYLTSGSVEVESLEGSATSFVSTGGSLSVECQQDLGAVVLLDAPAIEESLLAKRRIVSYLRHHIDSWFEYVTGSPNGLGYDLEMHDIKFVSGTIKTTKWACATLPRGKYTLEASQNDHGRLDISVSHGDSMIPNRFCNYGPVALLLRNTAAPSREGVARASMPSRADQCIFFHYYVLKRKGFPLPHKLQAAAGPHELPPDDPGAANSSPVHAAAESVSESLTRERLLSNTTHRTPGFDPVAVLLDYMLSKSGAEYAVASDMDVVAIFGADGVPDDTMAGLEAANPPIHVDETGVATVHVDVTWLDQDLSSQTVLPNIEDGVDQSSLRYIDHIPATAGEMQTPTGQQPIVDPPANDHTVPSFVWHAQRNRPVLQDPARRPVVRAVKRRAPNHEAVSPLGRRRRDRRIRAFLAQLSALRVGTTDNRFRVWNVSDRTLHKELTGTGGGVFELRSDFGPEDGRVTTAPKRVNVQFSG